MSKNETYVLKLWPLFVKLLGRVSAQLMNSPQFLHAGLFLFFVHLMLIISFVQLMLIISCLLKFICKSEISTCIAFAIICRHPGWQRIGVTMCVFPAEVKQSYTLPFCFSSHTLNTCPFYNPCNATFFTFLCFSWWFTG